ncbi:MAG: FecR family protein, partial [Verrucomicrobiota bacterium]
MNPDDHREQLIDMLLREHVGSETPPDVRSRVLEALQSDQRVAAGARPSFAQRRIVALPKRSIAGPLKAIAALIMLVAAALGLLHFQNIADERTPQLGSVEGRITGELHSGKSLSTGPDSSAELVYSDGTRVTLGPESAISIPELGLSDRSKMLEIHRGALTASVAPQPSGFPMEFCALHAKAVVVGTELSFRTDASATRLEVTEGTVELHPGDGRAPIEVTTGRFAETDASM